MRKTTILSSLVLLILFAFFGTNAWAEMSSTNYKIPADIVGGAGGESGSASYLLLQNLGEAFIQRTASANYGVEAGFIQSINTTIVMSIVNAPVDFGSLDPGANITDTVDLRVTTDAWNGYTLGINMQQHSNASCSDRYALCQSSGAYYIPNISATIASPAVWSEDGLGFTVSAGTSVEAKWNSGSNYAAVPSTKTTFHTKADYYAPASGTPYDSSTVRFKIQIPNSQETVTYDNTVTFTATAAL